MEDIHTNSILRTRIQTKEIKPNVEGEQPAFHRQNIWKWWNQDLLNMSRVGCIGAGGLGGNACRQLIRAGLGYIVICDNDIVELSNLNRQPFYEDDLYMNKALALAKNLEREATSNSIIDAYAMDFQDVVYEYADAFRNLDLVLVLVDNEDTRYFACEYFHKLKIPVIYSAVSRTGNSGYVFLQEPKHACYSCVKPKKDRIMDSGKNPCAEPSAIYIHQVMTGVVVYIAILKIMWKKVPWHWRDTFLREDARAINPPRREDCEVCGK